MLAGIYNAMACLDLDLPTCQYDGSSFPCVQALIVSKETVSKQKVETETTRKKVQHEETKVRKT